MAEDQQTDQEDKTEAATPKRLQRARDEGQAPVSREIVTLASLAGVALAFMVTGPSTTQDLAHRLSVFLSRSDAIALLGTEGFHLASVAAVYAVAPVLLAALVCGIGAVLLQTNFLISGSGARPKMQRISPMAGMGRLFSTESLIEGAKSVAKIAVIGFAVWQVLRADLPALLSMPFLGLSALLSNLMPMSLHVVLAVLGVQLIIAAADLFWVRFSHGRKLRMTRQDLRDETKETEGDPQIKARIRQIRLQRSRRRMLAAVSKATVVVTNPTHYAVALAYDRANSAAPRVVAKGVDSMAARIRDVAEANKVPLVANPPLARALYLVDLDKDIPAEHFQAVAEIIAYVWRLGQGNRRRGAEP
jgi:flagellar biosynthetic protein FlhB